MKVPLFEEGLENLDSSHKFRRLCSVLICGILQNFFRVYKNTCEFINSVKTLTPHSLNQFFLSKELHSTVAQMR